MDEFHLKILLELEVEKERPVSRKRTLDTSEDINVDAENEPDTNKVALPDPTVGRSSLEDSSRVSSGKRKKSVGVKKHVDTSEDLDPGAGPSGIRPRSFKKEEKEYVCNVCNEEFLHGYDFDEHFNIKHGSENSPCNSSTEVSAPKIGLQTFKTHTRDNLYAINRSQKKLATKKALKSHYVSHTDEKPYVCQVCAKAFSRKRYLNDHHRTHSGKKPYACEVCSKDFARKSHLNRHRSTHTDEKLFVCEVCKRKFSRRDYLLNHIRTHSGEKPYVCEVCKKEFAQKSHLNRHYRTHTGKKPFLDEDGQK